MSDAIQKLPAAAELRFCLRCGQPLADDGDRCTHCGLQFNTADPATYRAVPPFLFWHFWFPGVCLAIVSGVVSYAVIMKTGEMGLALFVSVPVSCGAILGYATRVRLWGLVLLAVPVIAGIVLTLVSLSLAGFFCGATLGLVFSVPMLSGIVLGVWLREILRAKCWGQWQYLPLITMVLFPYGAELVENQFPRPKVAAVVETDLTIDATPEEAWRALMFYEEVKHEPPFLLRLALPKPLRSEGRKSEPGDVVRCIYDRGRLCKQITEVEHTRRLAFVVTEQHLHFEHDVKLLDGSFALTPAAGGRTKLTLTTRYEKQLRPEWVWGPIERKVLHTLHGHVLEGIRRKAAADRQDKPEEPRYAPPRDPGLTDNRRPPMVTP